MYPLIILIIFIGAADPLYFEFVIEHNLAFLYNLPTLVFLDGGCKNKIYFIFNRPAPLFKD